MRTKTQIQELADSEPNSRGRSLIGIILSILVLLLISSLIVAAIVILNPEIGQLGARRRHSREAITLEEALLGSLSAREFQFQWSPASDSQRRTRSKEDTTDRLIYEDDRNLYLISLERRLAAGEHNSTQPNMTLLVSNTSLLSSIDYQGFKLSPSGRHLLVWTAKRKQFRHSFTAVYFLYDLQMDLISMLSTAAMQKPLQPPTAASPQLGPAANQFESLDSASFYLNQAALSGNLRESSQLPARFQLVDWFSTANGSDSLIMVQDNDIFVLNNVAISAQGTESPNSASSGQPIRLTQTGSPEVVFNGVPDWLYEEEILAGSTALRVAPDGQRLAFMSFNDSQVASFPFVVYGDKEQVEPEVRRIRQPRAGQPNPIVSVHVVEDLASGTTGPIELRLPDELSAREHYINRLQWLTNEKLGLIWSSRAQNESAVVICDQLKGWQCGTSHTWHSSDGWLDIGDHLLPYDSTHYLLLVPRFESPEVGSFTHLAKVSLERPNELTYLTSGRWEVVMINGVDPSRQLVYLTSTLAGEPGQRHLQVVEAAPRATGSGRCITCELHPDGRCQYNDVKLSPSNEYLVLNCDGPDVPLVELRRLQVLEAGEPQQPIKFSSQLLWTIEDNNQLRERLASRKAMPVQVRLRLPIEGSPHWAHALLLLPPLIGPTMTFRATPISLAPSSQALMEALGGHSSGSINRKRRWLTPGDSQQKLDSSDKQDGLESLRDYLSQVPPISLQKYPMIVEVYGGPNSQRVDQRFGIHLGHYFASSRRTIYAMIDVRGSGYEGTRRSFELHHKLGTVEVEDQLQVAGLLARGPLAQLVDPSKMAIWGWSYGGYAAAMALAAQSPGTPLAPPAGEHPKQARGREVFECAASVAPVTDWTLYDTAYTEKYMSSPWASEQFTREQEPSLDHPDDIQEVDHMQRGHAAQQGNKSSRQPKANHLNLRYRRASLLERVKAIDRRRFLLIHGTADDNVHYQHSVALMMELIKRNILFETRLYPDQDHSISGRIEKLHLGATLSNFFAECFDMAY